MNPIARYAAVGAAAASMLMPIAASAQATMTPADTWRFNVILYGFLPSIDGSLAFPVKSGNSSLKVDASTLLDSLNMTFMGTFDAHNGRWGVFTDLLYLDVSGSASKTRDLSLGGAGIPASVTADLDLNLKGLVWTVAGEYRIAADPALTVDALAGARYFGMKPTLSWNFNGDIGGLPLGGKRDGSETITQNVWDGIVGLKGQYALGSEREWKLPFYVDVGTGQSELTWQIAGGVGYSFHWGDVIAMWRYLDYRFKSDSKISDLAFNGPMVGVRFGW